MNSYMEFHMEGHTERQVLETGLAVALGSAMVHAREMLRELRAGNLSAVEFDATALQTCLQHPALREWLAAFPPGLLPVMRDPE